MSLGKEAGIADALLTYLGTLTFSPAMPVAYPGVGFTPPAGTYLDATLLPNRPINRGVADDSTTEFRGILQVTVVAPAGAGVVSVYETAGKIVEFFERTKRIIGNGFTIRIMGRPSVAAPLQEADRVRIPVSIDYWAYA